MPHRTRAQQRVDEIDVSPTALLAEIERLNAELEAAQAQAAEYLAGLQRERAEFQNFRRRTSEERERDAGLAADGLIRKVLALADDFDRAIETRPEALAGDPWVDGVTAIDRKLRRLLESEGVTAIAVTPGRAVRPAAPRGDRQRARIGPARRLDRRRAPARLPHPRPRPSTGPRGGRRRTSRATSQRPTAACPTSDARIGRSARPRRLIHHTNPDPTTRPRPDHHQE